MGIGQAQDLGSRGRRAMDREVRALSWYSKRAAAQEGVEGEARDREREG